MTDDERDEHHDELMDLAMDAYHHWCWRIGRQENPPEFDDARWLAEAERVFQEIPDEVVLEDRGLAAESYVPARAA